MKSHHRFRLLPAIGLALLALYPAATPALAAKDALSGAVFTTTVDGTVVNGNTKYDSKCAVYLDGGPGPNAPSKAAGLPAGDYYFQVTDPSGEVLLSTDPVSNRRFTVSTDGVIVAYSGFGGPTHPTGIDQDHAAKGAITIRLANLDCPTDFKTTPNDGGIYKVWVTPVGNNAPTGGGFVGDPALVDNGYSPGYYHGFLPARSKTDNFKVKIQESTVTFCLTVRKQLVVGSNIPDGPGANWPFFVLNPQNVENTYHTQALDTVPVDQMYAEAKICSLTPGTYTVREDQFVTLDNKEYSFRAIYVNGELYSEVEPFYTFDWQAGDPEPVILFQNKYMGEAQPIP